MNWAVTAPKPLRLLQGDVHTAVCVSVGKTGLAAVCVVDEVREDALKSIRFLKQNGIKTTMLTGDRAEIANETAHSFGY